jgi:hypothetical protein
MNKRRRKKVVLKFFSDRPLTAKEKAVLKRLRFKARRLYENFRNKTQEPVGRSIPDATNDMFYSVGCAIYKRSKFLTTHNFVI